MTLSILGPDVVFNSADVPSSQFSFHHDDETKHHFSNGELNLKNLEIECIPFPALLKDIEKEVSGSAGVKAALQRYAQSRLLNATVAHTLFAKKVLSEKMKNISLCFPGTIYKDKNGLYIRYLWRYNNQITFLSRYLHDRFDKNYQIALLAE